MKTFIGPGDPVIIRGGIWHRWEATFHSWAEDGRTIVRPAFVTFAGRQSPVWVPGVKRKKKDVALRA